MSRRTTKQRRAARRRQFRCHVARCRTLVRGVGAWAIIAACLADWGDERSPGGSETEGADR